MLRISQDRHVCRMDMCGQEVHMGSSLDILSLSCVLVVLLKYMLRLVCILVNFIIEPFFKLSKGTTCIPNLNF